MVYAACPKLVTNYCHEITCPHQLVQTNPITHQYDMGALQYFTQLVCRSNESYRFLKLIYPFEFKLTNQLVNTTVVVLAIELSDCSIAHPLFDKAISFVNYHVTILLNCPILEPFIFMVRLFYQRTLRYHG